jgi:hypothetical protein
MRRRRKRRLVLSLTAGMLVLVQKRLSDIDGRRQGRCLEWKHYNRRQAGCLIWVNTDAAVGRGHTIRQPFTGVAGR